MFLSCEEQVILRPGTNKYESLQEGLLINLVKIDHGCWLITI